MAGNISSINGLMVEVFNDILQIEEQALKCTEFNDLSIKEMHTIEAIGIHNESTMGDIASKLGITLGTLTVAINNLTKKSYVQRIKSELDKRVVKVALTTKGRLLYRLHERFHRNLIENAVKGLDEIELNVLTRALSQIHGFFIQQSSKRIVNLE